MGSVLLPCAVVTTMLLPLVCHFPFLGVFPLQLHSDTVRAVKLGHSVKQHWCKRAVSAAASQIMEEQTVPGPF